MLGEIFGSHPHLGPQPSSLPCPQLACIKPRLPVMRSLSGLCYLTYQIPNHCEGLASGNRGSSGRPRAGALASPGSGIWTSSLLADSGVSVSLNHIEGGVHEPHVSSSTPREVERQTPTVFYYLLHSKLPFPGPPTTREQVLNLSTYQRGLLLLLLLAQHRPRFVPGTWS